MDALQIDMTILRLTATPAHSLRGQEQDQHATAILTDKYYNKAYKPLQMAPFLWQLPAHRKVCDGLRHMLDKIALIQSTA